MSVEAIRWVMEHPLRRSDQHVLLVLAYHARPDGSGAYPSQVTIAREAGGLSRATVARAIGRLHAAGRIERISGRGRSNRYRIVMTEVARWCDISDRPDVSPSRDRVSHHRATGCLTIAREVEVEPSFEPKPHPPRVSSLTTGADEPAGGAGGDGEISSPNPGDQPEWHDLAVQVVAEAVARLDEPTVAAIERAGPAALDRVIGPVAGRLAAGVPADALLASLAERMPVPTRDPVAVLRARALKPFVAGVAALGEVQARRAARGEAERSMAAVNAAVAAQRLAGTPGVSRSEAMDDLARWYSDPVILQAAVAAYDEAAAAFSGSAS